jgi:hypothetical protein
VNLTFLHLLSWVVYSVLDLGPLALIDHSVSKEDMWSQSISGVESSLKWMDFDLEVEPQKRQHSLYARLALLTVSGIVVPLLLPTRHVPIDPSVSVLASYNFTQR